MFLAKSLSFRLAKWAKPRDLKRLLGTFHTSCYRAVGSGPCADLATGRGCELFAGGSWDPARATSGEEQKIKVDASLFNQRSESNDSVPRVLLIDLDNCPHEVEHLVQRLEQFDRVVVCHGASPPRVPLSLVQLLGRAMDRGDLEIVAMPQGGRNAADFAIAFHAGRMVEMMPADTEVAILSKDHDLKSVVSLLVAAGFRAQRICTADNPPDLDYEVITESYVEQRLRNGLGRPVRRATLQNSIRTFFKKQAGIRPEKVIECLVQTGVVAFEESGATVYFLERDDPLAADGPNEDWSLPF